MTRANELVRLVHDAFGKEVIKKLVFSRPRGSEITKISGRLVAHRGQKFMAFELSLPGNTVSHKNIKEDMLDGYVGELLAEYKQANLITTVGECEWKISSSGKEALLGAERLSRRLVGEGEPFESAAEALDAAKNRIVKESEPFLIGLGISDKNGRVHDKKQGKYRQINRFLEHIADIYPSLKGEGPLTVYDLCCGKSYLSFAVYYYLTALCHREVNMLCIDMKRDVILWCRELAERLGFSGMKFVCDDVRNTPQGVTPDLVVSLHACDIATDIVIDTAAALGAQVILSTPCCHRYLTDKLDMPSLDFVTRHPHLKNKLAEVLTDAIRSYRLYSLGYEVSALELTDPTDTPKNTLIRAVRKSVSDRVLSERASEYRKILALTLGEGWENYLKEIEK
ncbi:MAG: SAM-dependent methyltransferase [Clostridia bacterium]|nr:SAM-dependent methyltransferase [Clostridia bacterium]